jgi:hypothetical protein
MAALAKKNAAGEPLGHHLVIAPSISKVRHIEIATHKRSSSHVQRMHTSARASTASLPKLRSDHAARQKNVTI